MEVGGNGAAIRPSVGWVDGSAAQRQRDGIPGLRSSDSSTPTRASSGGGAPTGGGRVSPRADLAGEGGGSVSPLADPAGEGGGGHPTPSACAATAPSTRARATAEETNGGAGRRGWGPFFWIL